MNSYTNQSIKFADHIIHMEFKDFIENQNIVTQALLLSKRPKRYNSTINYPNMKTINAKPFRILF